MVIFDEPTKGLHFEDVRKLVVIMRKMVDKGNSIIIVEHNADVIASCDYVIDIGPGGGTHGGCIVGAGTPLELSQMDTLTGRVLKDYYSNIKKYEVFLP